MTLQPADIPPAILAFHRHYETLTGHAITLNWHQMDCWRVFMGYRDPGFTHEELTQVVRHIRRGILNQRRNPGALKFSNLIGSPDRFEEDLSEARAMNRPRPPKTIDVVINGTGRRVENSGTQDASRPIGEVIEAMRRAAG